MSSEEADLIQQVWEEGYGDAVTDAATGHGPAAAAALRWAATRAEETGLYGIAHDLRTWATEAVAE